jgi:hypothetical protein
LPPSEKHGQVDKVTPRVSFAAIANVTGRPPLAAVLRTKISFALVPMRYELQIENDQSTELSRNSEYSRNHEALYMNQQSSFLNVVQGLGIRRYNFKSNNQHVRN